MNMKKILAVILTTVLLLSVMPMGMFTITANAETSGTTAEGLGYYTIGDLDEDEELTDWDGVMLARYLAGWSIEIPAIEALDIDGDGEITDWDGVMFDRQLAGWSVSTEAGKKLAFNITYLNTKGATNINPNSLQYGNAETNLLEISAPHYTFDGWYVGNLEYTSIPANQNGDLALTAKWTPIEYSITYNNTRGAVNTNPTSYNIESDTITLNNLTADGYSFAGWYNGNQKVTSIQAGSGGNITLTAKWIPCEYTITYNNTKDSTNNNVTGFNVDSETIILSDLQKDGFIFEGWYRNGVKVTQIDKGTVGNIELTAKWTTINYTIKYSNIMGAVNTNPTTYNIESDTIILSNINTSGYSFDGWYNGNQKVTSIPSGSCGNIILTAKWTPCEYNIIYNNTKDAINSNATGFNTDSETIILSDLHKEGYAFDGWYQNDVKVTEITKGTIGDVVLTAKWTIITYTATFVSDNSIVDIRYFTVEDPEIANLPTVPQKEHYIGKWSAYSISSKDLTINAEYTAKEYTITYINTHGGTNSNPTKYTIESDTITLNAPIAEGYRFVGWYIGDEIIEKVDNGTTGNIELIAKWTLINYIATFKYENTVIATRNFTVEDSEITDVPDVPTTTYYDVSWESYKILPQDITINAVNTLKSGYSYITFDKGDGASSQGIVIAKLGDSMPKLNYSLVAPAGYKFLGYYDGITDYATMYYNSNLEGTRDWDKRGSNVTLYARYKKQEWYHDYSLWVVNISTSSTRYHFSSFCKDYNLQLLSTGTTTVTIKNSNGKTVFQKEYSKSSSIQTTKLTLEIGEIYYITTTSTQTGGYYRILNDIGNYVSHCPYDSYFCNIVYSNTKSAQNNNPEKICAYCLNEQEWISGEPYILKDIKKSGYMFDGWFLNGKKVTQITINDFEYYTDGYNVDYRDIELVAKMTPITYTATFYVDGNIVGITNFTMEDEEILNVPATPVREHYTGKWEYTIVPNDIIITEFSYIPTEYTISYENTDSASHFNPSTYNIENSVILKDAYREHYTFEGWYLNGQLVTEIPTGTTGDIVIVAKWKPITYTITYSSCFGSAPSATTYTVENQSIILPRMSDIEGYYFYGWFIGNSEVTSFDTKTGKDITLIAKWAPKQAIGSDDVNYTVNKSSPYVSWAYIHKDVTCNWDASSRTYVIEIQLDVVGLNQDGISGGYVYGELYIDGEYAGTWTYPGSFEHHNNRISPIKYLVS